MSELCSFLRFKLYSLNFAITHAKIKIVMLFRIGHTCVAIKHKKTDLSLETSSEINFELIQFVHNLENSEIERTYSIRKTANSVILSLSMRTNGKCNNSHSPSTKTNRNYKCFCNLRFITIFDNFLLPNQLDLSAHCSYHFLTCYVLRLRNTLVICP